MRLSSFSSLTSEDVSLVAAPVLKHSPGYNESRPLVTMLSSSSRGGGRGVKTSRPVHVLPSLTLTDDN